MTRSRFSYAWNGQQVTMGPVLDKSKATQVEDQVQQSKIDLFLVDPRGNEALLASANGTMLSSNDKMAVRLVTLLESHLPAYPGAAQDLQALKDSFDGMQVVQRVTQAYKSGLDAGTATAQVRGAENAQTTKDITDKVVSMVEQLRLAGQPVPKDLGAIYDGIQGETDKLAQRQKDGQTSAAKARTVASASEEDSQKLVELTSMVRSQQAEIARLTTLVSPQALTGAIPTVKTAEDRKNPRH